MATTRNTSITTSNSNITVEEIVETLNAEQFVDLAKLRAAARYGLSSTIRGEVWLYLLQVLSPDRTNEITSIRSKYSAYVTMDKSPSLIHRVRLESTRYYNRRLLPYTRRRRVPVVTLPGNTTSSTTTTTTTTTLRPIPTIVQTIVPNQIQQEEPMDVTAFSSSVESVLSAYLNRNRDVEYSHGLVALVAPFAWTLKTEAGIYFCFEGFMQIIQDYTMEKSLPVQISSFLSLFRQFLPDLHNYFEEEAVDMRELATTWLQWLFAKEMQIGMLMRLWDVYFSIPDPLELHPFVCLAILTTCKDALEELDQSEVRSMLLSLPPMDVERLIVEATNLRLAYKKSQNSKDTFGERIDY